MQEICLVYLLRKGNPPCQFRRFIDSYRKHPVGCDHHLLILYKGFENNEQLEEYRDQLDNTPHYEFSVSDEGFDISAYLAVARGLGDKYRYFCFTNSHSTIQCDNWLAKLHHHIQRENVGLVGTSGSWISHRGCISTLHLYLSAQLFILRLRLASYSTETKRKYIDRIKRHLKWLLSFDRFPNPHLRTNGFMIASATLNEIEWPTIRSKEDAYLFESGQNGLSAKINIQGKRILVVGCNGRALPPALWSFGELFFQARQENLMLADNQTRQYEFSNKKIRHKLHMLAWTPPQTLLVSSLWQAQINRDKYAAQDSRQRERLRTIADKRNDNAVKIVLYGAGVINSQLRHWLRENTPQITVAATVDSHVSRSSFNGEALSNPATLIDGTLDWDYVLIASHRFYEEIHRDLLEQGIADERII